MANDLLTASRLALAIDGLTSVGSPNGGTPCYVYDLDEVRQAYAALTAALPAPHRLLYSLKANPHHDVVAALIAAGCGAEVSSRGELVTALRAGGRGDHVVATGPGKTDGFIHDALAVDAVVSVESPAELRRVRAVAARSGVRARCLVRVHHDGVAGPAGLRMTGRPSQFGWPMHHLLDHAGWVESDVHAAILGVHLFAATNVTDGAVLADLLADAARVAGELGRRCRLPLAVVDLGGGFPAPYGVTGGRASLDSLRDVGRAIDLHLPGWREGAPLVLFESGRFLTATAGTLLTTVVDVKRSGDEVFVVCDAGINHLGGMAGLRRLRAALFDVSLVGRDEVGMAGETVTLVGPLCTPLDVLARNVPLPPVEPGDVLAVPSVGAYGLTASLLGFLSHDLPLEVVLDGTEARVTQLRLTREPAVSDG